MLSEALHGGAAFATAAATATLLVPPRREHGAAVGAAVLMTAAMVDTILGRWIDPVWWVSAQIIVAVALAVAARVAAGSRRAPVSTTTLHESIALLFMAATMARMVTGQPGAAHHHAASDGLGATVAVLFLLYAGVTVHHVRERRRISHRLHALLMAGAATMMLAAAWSA